MMHDEEGMYDPVPCPLNPDFSHEDHAEKNGVRSQRVVAQILLLATDSMLQSLLS